MTKRLRGAAVVLLGMAGVVLGQPAAAEGGNDSELSFRERRYRAYLPVEMQQQRLKMEISSYLENPTGICFQAGEQITVTVTGGEGQELRLIVHDFTDQKEKWFGITHRSQDGVQKTKVEPLPTHSEYELKEGVNTITLTTSGLGYLHYRSMSPESAPQVRVHIDGGRVNGVLTRADDTAAWKRLLAGACYPVMDMLGDRIHLILPVSGLREGCPEDGPELLALYDRILELQQEDLMGMSLYGVSTGSHILARLILDTPLCAGEMAAFFPYHAFPGMASVQNVTRSSWGAAHELGHLHQTRPGFMWIGMVEVTNNLASAYVNYRLDPNHLRLEHSTTRNACGDPMPGGIFDCFVNNAIPRRRLWQFHGGALPQGLPKSWEDSSRDVFVDVVPLWQLFLYNMEARGQKDFYPHIYQAVRTTDESRLTQGELRVLFFMRACDAAQLNLTEFFVKTGMLAPLDRMVNDYSHAHMTITREMCDKAMSYADRYPKPESSVIYYINANNMPLFRDKKELELKPGVKKLRINRDRMEVPTSLCPGAVAYEAYRGHELLHVSLLGLGCADASSTVVICPPGTDSVKAVQWDGKRVALLGHDAPMATGEPLEDWLVRTNGIYSLHEAAQVGHGEALQARLSGPTVRHNQYGWVVKTDEGATAAEVNAQNEQGNTPLHLAAAGGHAEAVRMLLQAGADKTLRNRAGMTPADMAEGDEVRKLLE